MNRTLLTQALIKFLAGILLIGLLGFLPAGSFAYWQGWLLMGVLFVPMFFAGIVMLAKNPDLLRKRLNAKEKEGEQKAVVALSGLLFTLSFVTMLGYIPVIANRIRNEEMVLSKGLDGYKEYMKRVKHKVIPFLW